MADLVEKKYHQIATKLYTSVWLGLFVISITILLFELFSVFW